MTRTKIYGINTILIIVLLLTACSTINTVKNIQKNGLVWKEMYTYYVNDSLTLSYRFPGGGYDQITKKNKIRNFLVKAGNSLPLNYCIACFKTTNPAFTHFTFYFPNTKLTIHNKLLNAVKKDTTDFYVDTNKSIVGKFVSLENNKGSVYIIGHSKKNQFSNLKKEYADVFNHIVKNEKYRDITFTPPFELAREREIDEDSTVNYLMPVHLLKENESNYTSISSKYYWLQAYGTFVSRLTSEQKEIQECVNKFTINSIKRDELVSSENTMPINDDALSYLIQNCKDEQVVMINENHFAPQHRILGEIILDSLYNYGFRYLGMEAIWENDTVLNERGFAVTHTGFYTREPMMANLIRKAIEKGYYIFGYDDFTDDREKMEAINIYQKTILKDSLCKVLIWAGLGHIDESKYMAREFFLLTGIDPLTINQTNCITEGDEYLMILDTTTLKNRRNTCDIFVANNINYDIFAVKSDFKNYKIGIPKEIAKQVKNNPLTFIVSIFRTSEYQKDKTAIPVYNHVLSNKSSKISIKLPDNEYYYIIKHKYGKILYQNIL